MIECDICGKLEYKGKLRPMVQVEQGLCGQGNKATKLMCCSNCDSNDDPLFMSLEKYNKQYEDLQNVTKGGR